MNIYELTHMEKGLIVMLEDTETPEEEREQIIRDTMEGAGLDDKLNSYGKIMRTLENDEETLDEEIARLTARKKSIQRNIDKLKESLLFYMDETGKTKEKTALFSFGIRESASTRILDEAAVPQDFIKTKTETSVDKSSVLKILKAGGTVPGCELQKTRKAFIK